MLLFHAIAIQACFLIFTVAGGKERKRDGNGEDQTYFSQIVETINAAPGLKWKAKQNPFGVRRKIYNFSSNKNTTALLKTFADIQRFSESTIMQQHIRELEEFPSRRLPLEFDARLKWPFCPSIHNVPNQGGCGSCYAVAAVGVASDRACIMSNGSFRSMFSEQDVLSCCKECGSCYGGDPLRALVYWVNKGLVTGGRDGCVPYSVDRQCGIPCPLESYINSEMKRICNRKCQRNYYFNTYENDKHFASIAYSMFPRTISLDNSGNSRKMIPSVIAAMFNMSNKEPTRDQVIQVIKKEIYLYGPTTIAFPVTEEFLHYSTGVFSPFPETNYRSRIIYWHVARLIGWGETPDGTFYWLAVNSFGNYWGENGLFRIDTKLIEDDGVEYEAALI